VKPSRSAARESCWHWDSNQNRPTMAPAAWRWLAHIAKTVRREHLILIAEAVIEPDVERILAIHVILVGR